MPSTVCAGQIALVIDDLGYHKHDLKAVQLPAEVSIAILPHTPYGKRIAEQASAAGKEVLLHIPMASLSGKRLGPGALEVDMDATAITETLEKAYAEIPQAVGINNHMGSLGTQVPGIMNPTMAFLQANGMYFLDSVTTRYSIGAQLANHYQVPFFSRQVFLDNNVDEASLAKQMAQLVRIAKKHQQAIGIAHPYPETLAYLQKALPKLQAQGVTVVPLSQLKTKSGVLLSKTPVAPATVAAN